ncbi:MAG TPA: diguanylate cyclase [Aquabacterium sp.]|uniref:GGDEF domain-containing protein n=1 Tax=Aquabacterium sp. TaxID=1872578 RepID=UPI002E319A23|nr:diguanylate cyclase [Aquabacterium sp.]HEX5373077.1 diguanylate cyclase [Aquabacterium sp.]
MMRALMRWIEGGLKHRQHTSSAVLYTLATVPMLMVLWGLQAYALSDAQALAHYRPGALPWAQHLLTGLIVWQVACGVYAWWSRDRMDEERPLLAWCTVTPTLLGLLALSIAYGLKDTPMGMVVIEELVVARALFPLRILRPALVLGVAMIMGYEWAHAQGMVGDSPLLSAPVFRGVALDPWWALWLRVVLHTSLWPFALGVFFLFNSLARHRVDLETLARTDMLTGLANRREFMTRLADESHRQARAGHACTVVVCDIDHFKRINDQYGHPAGDAVLAEVGRLLRTGVRQHLDLAARIGGEEFALILPETDVQGGQRVAEKLARALKAHPFTANGQTWHVTLSAGVAEVQGGRGEMALRAADAQLYAAKAAGRDRVASALA